MVAALRVSRQGPASRSAALRKIAARSSKDMSRQPGAAAFAASTAACASSWVASAVVPRTWAWACGWTTSTSLPEAIRHSPPMFMGSASHSPASAASRDSRAARRALPGSYWWTGSLHGDGDRGDGVHGGPPAGDGVRTAAPSWHRGSPDGVQLRDVVPGQVGVPVVPRRRRRTAPPTGGPARPPAPATPHPRRPGPARARPARRPRRGRRGPRARRRSEPAAARPAAARSMAARAAAYSYSSSSPGPTASRTARVTAVTRVPAGSPPAARQRRTASGEAAT